MYLARHDVVKAPFESGVIILISFVVAPGRHKYTGADEQNCEH
jgi:hypothetical protein